MNKKNDIIKVNDIGEKGKASLKSRIVVAAVLIALTLPCIILGGWYWFGIISIFLLIAIHEVIKAPNRKYRWYIYLFTYILIVSFVYWFLLRCNVIAYNDFLLSGATTEFSPKLEDYFSNLSISLYGVAVALVFYFFVAIIHDDFSLQDVCYLFTISLLVGLGFQALMFLRFYPTYLGAKGWYSSGVGVVDEPLFKYWQSSELLIFVALGTILNDTFAYFVGLFFGKHHMNERISPKKTWEGFFGGWFFGSALCLAFGLITASLGTPILPTMDISHWYWVLLVSILIPLFGDLGDFSFSLIKRFFGVKDFGTILKAHGGVLDRADSLIFASIASSVLVVFIQGGWNFFV